MRRVFSSALLVLVLGASGVGRAAPDRAAPQRVLTLNAGGIWMVSPAREARLAAMGPAVAALRPDVVAMQEVWVDADAAVLAAALAAEGLIHTRRFSSSWPGDSGLFVASRYPIERTEFLEYAQGTHPDIPWHLDWMAAKGIARVRIQTPAGAVDIANTHLQAGYGSRRYELVQLSQLMEAADFLDPVRDAPLVVAGDLNVSCRSLPYRAFARRLELRPTDPGCGIDSVSVRGGGALDLAVTKVQAVLTGPVALPDGSVRTLSDHPGLLVELALVPADVVAAPAAAPPWLDVAREALGRIYAERAALARAQLRDGVLAAVLLQASLLLIFVRRRWRGPSWAARHPLAAMIVAALLATSWFGYLGASYAPKHLDELNRVRLRLETAVAAGALGEP